MLQTLLSGLLAFGLCAAAILLGRLVQVPGRPGRQRRPAPEAPPPPPPAGIRGQSEPGWRKAPPGGMNVFGEYLKGRPDAGAEWDNTMAGIQVCRFSLEVPEGQPPLRLPLTLGALHFEALFCRGGGVVLERSGGKHMALEPGNILLLSNCGGLRQVTVEQVPGRNTGGSGRPGRPGQPERPVRPAGRAGAGHRSCGPSDGGLRGLRPAGAHPWSQAVFEELEHLKGPEQGRYCVWKAAELLYLLCQHSPLLSGAVPAAPVSGRMARRVRDMRAYMEGHLQEKLTIPEVCRRFYLSPTSFKKYFRAMYGQSVHRWLQHQRLERAAQLLRTTRLSVLQIAQSVGYSGLSQFNAAFKQHFHLTPRQYRNTSDSGKKTADSAGQPEDE